MTSLLTRRSLLRGLFAMPAVVAASSLMPVRGIIVPLEPWSAEKIRELRDIAYTITRKQIDDNLYRAYFNPPPLFGDFMVEEIAA